MVSVSSGSVIIFSPVFTYSGKSCRLSPDGKRVVFSNGTNVSVMNVETQCIEFTLFCSDRVDAAEWSSDSNLISCLVKRNNSIEVVYFYILFTKVFSITDLSWNIAFRNEDSPIVSIRWSPDNSSILSLGEAGIQIAVWSLHSRKVY